MSVHEPAQAEGDLVKRHHEDSMRSETFEGLGWHVKMVKRSQQ